MAQTKTLARTDRRPPKGETLAAAQERMKRRAEGAASTMDRLAVYLAASLTEAAELCRAIEDEHRCGCCLPTWQDGDKQCDACAMKEATDGLPFMLDLARGSFIGLVSSADEEIAAVLKARMAKWADADQVADALERIGA